MSDHPRPATPGDARPSPAEPEAPQLGGRLHPSVIAVWSIRGLAPLLFVSIASSAIELALAFGLLVLLLGGSWVRWLRFTWRIEPGQLVIEQGLLQRRRRVIPFARIQAVQAVRKLHHRVFGVVGLQVEAIGGAETEGQLDALRLDVAEQVQLILIRRTDLAAGTDAVDHTARQANAVREDGAAGHGTDKGEYADHDLGDARPRRIEGPSWQPSAAPAGLVLAHCSPQRLLLAGVTGGRVGVAAAAIGLAQQVFGDRVTEAAFSAPERFGWVVVLVVVLLGIVAAFVLSVAATALTYWDFTVRRDGDLLRLHRGLLDERRDTVPLRRVQSVTVEQNILRRALGLAAVTMTVAGRAGDDNAVTGTLLPIGTRDEALGLVGEVLDLPDFAGVQLMSMPFAARARRLVRAAVFAIAGAAATWLATVAVAGVTWPIGAAYGAGAMLVLVAVSVPAALASYRALGWARTDKVLLGRAGWLVQRTSVTPIDATQSARLTSSPFQRRRDLATLRVEVARAGGRDPRLIDLAETDGRGLLHVLAAQDVNSLQW